jgi:branched-chain amino acid transport system permease protein
MSDPIRRIVAPTASALGLFAVLVLGLLAYSAVAGPAGGSLVTQMLINAIIVVGMQVYIGNTGVLSFGHIGFAAIAGYTFAILAISVDRKSVTISSAPFGLSSTEWAPGWAMAAAVVVALVVALVIGFGLARSGAHSGAVAATVITLALLVMVHEVAVNWDELTGGDRAGLSFSIGDSLASRWPIYAALLAALLVARLFGRSYAGRRAKAAREDGLAARAMGLNPTVEQTIALLASVVIVAIGGALRVYELGSITPKFFYFDFTLLTLTMLIVGGRNSTTGALLGVIVISAGNEVTRYLSGPDVTILEVVLRPGLSEMFLGTAMLGFMIFRPNGLIDDWELDDWLLARWRSREDPAPASRDAAVGDAGAAASGPDGTAGLVASGITVHFGGFEALRSVDLTASGSGVTGIIGPNGAGKTTLLNVLTGLVVPTDGMFTLDGRPLTGSSPHAIARAGLVRTFQNLRLFPALSVHENVAVASLANRRSGSRRSAPGPTADELVAAVGLWEQRHRRARELDYGSARRLELARAAAGGPRFLLLDEPTSGMSEAESEAMIGQVRRIAELAGAAVIVIDHDLGFITGICDRIYCLDQGRVLAIGTPDEIRADRRVQEAYLGAAAADSVAR